MALFKTTLGTLADPGHFCEPIEISGETIEFLLGAYKKIYEIRLAEETIAEAIVSGECYTPCHLSVGQEAVAVGISSQLTRNDHVFSNHRSHAHYLALGAELDSFFAEVLCKETGVSGGYGGSQHLINKEVGFSGSLPIVGGTIPVALGAAFASKLKKENSITVCYFGDGACEEGVLHESLNLASTLKLPILFVCENNLFSSHLDISLRQPTDSVSRFPKAHCIETKLVDGNDLVEVKSAAFDLISAIRDGQGPAFIEAITYRHFGHVGGNRDIDVGLRRSEEELALWLQRDPLLRLKNSLLKSNPDLNKELGLIESAVKDEIRLAFSKARQAPEPS